MEKIKAAVVGYGHIGQFVVEAIQAAEDFELSGVVVRNLAKAPKDTGLNFVDKIDDLGNVDVAILGVPSRSVPACAKELLAKGIHTVDSFDIHTQIWDVKQELDAVAKENGTVAVISAGWDPGSDSVVRSLLMAAAPKGITYTNFGPGMSMGHSVAAKGKTGVRDALSMTIPTGTGVHRRMVYVEMEDGADFEQAKNEILADDYFCHDDSRVFQVPSIQELQDMGHGVSIERKGVSGKTHNQLFEFNMRINNPALTAQILVSTARAATRQKSGCYTMIEIPPIDYLYGEKEALIKTLV